MIRPVESIDAAREQWTSLAERSDNIFSTWEWADVWWRHFGSGRTLRIAVVLDSETPVGILPIHTERRAGLRVSRFVGHGVADQLGPVCGPTHARAAMAELAGTFVDGGVLLADRLADDRDWAKEVSGRVVYREASPSIDLARDGSWEDYLSAQSSNFRQQVRRRTRRLERGLGLRYRLAQNPAQLTSDFDALVALHTMRWGPGSPAFRSGREAFHREFAARALERGWLRLWLAEGRGHAGRSLVRLPVRRRRVLLPGGSRPGLGSLLHWRRNPGAIDP
jgi:CelD/BcsL family acetyltransferase involved in cellulose biosynthesis